MSRKTHYKTFTQPDLATLENEVNGYIRSLYKDEKLEGIKVDDITTFAVNNTFFAAVTYSNGKKKKPEDMTVSIQEKTSQSL